MTAVEFRFVDVHLEMIFILDVAREAANAEVTQKPAGFRVILLEVANQFRIQRRAELAHVTLVRAHHLSKARLEGVRLFGVNGGHVFQQRRGLAKVELANSTSGCVLNVVHEFAVDLEIEAGREDAETIATKSICAHLDIFVD